MPKCSLISLGCNKNLVDSEVMLGRLKDYELTNTTQEADIIIINTCGFIASAKKESIDKILEVVSDKKDDAILVVSGCLSERYANELRDEIPEIDIIMGVGDYDKIDSIINSHNAKKPKISVESPQNSPLVIKTNRTFLIDSQSRIITGSKIHTYIKISEGCNQQCSFCAIPHFKGKLRSRSLESIMKEIDILLENGFCDISFIAQDSSSYMHDFGKKDALIELIKNVEKSGIKSARINYLYPNSTSDKLIATIAESNVFQNYFDMPIQHITDSMLKTMRRRADKRRHIELLRQMRACENSFIRTTFLLGHPNESERDFEELCEFVSEFAFDRANIFAFSKEDGTTAFKMANEVDKKITKSRIKSLNAILKNQQENSFKSLVGWKIPVIIDGLSEQSPLLFSGRDVRWDREIDGEILINDSNIAVKIGYYEAEITDFKGGFLLGRVIRAI